MRIILYALSILISSTAVLHSQSLTIFEQGTTTPIADAIIIQSGKLIGATDEQGYCELKEIDIKSKVCIKTFGFVDTCFKMPENNIVIYLQPVAFETTEVNVNAIYVTPKEQFLKFLNHSVSLSNEKDEVLSYRFTIETKPHATELVDKMKGVFSYIYPSVDKKVGYRRLYQCSAEHIISKALLEDSVTRFSMSNGGLIFTMMHMYHLRASHIKSNKKHLNEQRLDRIITDSSFVFTYIDSTWYPSKFTWHFDKTGRLKECEFIRILDEAERSIIHIHGKQYVKQTYTTSGVLRIKQADVLQIYKPTKGVHYSTSIELELLNNYASCISQDMKYVPVDLSISSWAKLYKIPSLVIDE